MKLLRYRIGFALLLLLFSGALGQNLSAWQVTTLQNAATATGNGTTMPSSAMGAVSVQITGTFSATVTFEGTMDGSTWVALMATNANDDARATTATAAGVYSVVLNGCTSFRARISSYSSGTVTVKARLGNGVISRTSSAGGGGGSGADPTGSVGLSAVNGVALTFLRSDAAPALNQGITPTWTGAHIFAPEPRSSGSASFFQLRTPADTTLTASAEAIGARFGGDASAATVTRQWAAGALATQRENVFIRPTYSFASPSTLTNAATVAITGAPAAGPNATITFPSALSIESGNLAIATSSIIGPIGASVSGMAGIGLSNNGTSIRTGFSISTDTGTFYSNSSSIFNWSNGFGGPGGLYVESVRVFGFSNSVFMRGAASANLAFGAADAASPVAQTLSVQNGSGSNIAGANWTRDASRGTGTGAGGAHIWRIAPAGSSGSSQNALVERMRLDENGLKFTEVSSTTTPSSNTISVYAKDKGGVSALYLKNDAGTEAEVGTSPYTAPPAVAGWTWVNQGSATGTDTTSGIDLYAPNGSGDNLRILARAVPSTPYTITAAISITMFADNYAAAGFCWRESGTGEVAYVGLTHATTYTLGFNKYASLTSYDSTYFNNSFAPGDVLWIKASDDGTNRTVSISRTGTSWLQIATHTRTDFLTPDQVGFFANSNQSTVTTGVLATLRSWSVQ